MSAGCGRAKKPGGRIPRGSLRRSMDGLRLLAARFPRGPPTQVVSAARRRQQCRRRDPVRPEARAASRRARGKRLRGAAPSLPDRDFTGGSEGRPTSGFVETVTTQEHRARPGRSAPSPTRFSRSGEESCAVVSPSPSGGGSSARSDDGVGRARRRKHRLSRAKPLPPGFALGSATLPRGGGRTPCSAPSTVVPAPPPA